jgi:hypothetical protein
MADQRARSAPPRSRALTRREYRDRDLAIWFVSSLLFVLAAHLVVEIADAWRLEHFIQLVAVVTAAPAAEVFARWLLGPRP